MIALFRLTLTTTLGVRKPLTPWTDDLDMIMEEAIKYEREHLRIERVMGQFESAEIDEEALEAKA